MLSLGAQRTVSGLRLGEDHTKACVMLSRPVCKPRSPPERSLVSFLDEDQTETRLMLSLPGLLAEPTNNLHGGPAVTAKLWHSLAMHLPIKVAFFSQVQPCSSSILRGNPTVSTVPGLCDNEI